MYSHDFEHTRTTVIPIYTPVPDVIPADKIKHPVTKGLFSSSCMLPTYNIYRQAFGRCSFRGGVYRITVITSIYNKITKNSNFIVVYIFFVSQCAQGYREVCRLLTF